MKHARLPSGLRKFWLYFIGLVLVLASMTVSVLLIGTSEPHNQEISEEAYIAQMLAIEPINPPLYRELSSLEDLFLYCRPNLVVRCKALSRAAVTVWDPFQEHTVQSLFANPRAGGLAYIATPYRMEITEVFAGDEKRFPVGSIFWYYAPYGQFDDELKIRYQNYPLFMAESEYLLFFYVSRVLDQDCFELANPYAALEITAEDPNTFRTLTDCGDVVFSPYHYSVIELEEAMQILTARYPAGEIIETEPYGQYK